MVIVPADGPAGNIIGPNGSYIGMLKNMTGLRRITVVRSVANHRPDHRIAAAVRQITGLQFVKIRRLSLIPMLAHLR
jgi:transcription antitermination factor NusA-like protein